MFLEISQISKNTFFTEHLPATASTVCYTKYVTRPKRWRTSGVSTVVSNIIQVNSHCVKSVQIRSFFWSEYRKIRTRKNFVFGHFSRSVWFIVYRLKFIVYRSKRISQSLSFITIIINALSCSRALRFAP